MKRKYTKEEKEAWLRGKIAGYYSSKTKCKGKSKVKEQSAVVKYSNFNADDAFRAALERTYK